MLQAFSASVNGGDAALEPFFRFRAVTLRSIFAGQSGLNRPNSLEMKEMLVCVLFFPLLEYLAQSENGFGIIAMRCRDSRFSQSPIR